MYCVSLAELEGSLFTCACMCMCVCMLCVHIHTCIHMYMHSCVYEGQRLTSDIFLYCPRSLSPSLFEVGSLSEPGVHSSGQSNCREACNSFCLSSPSTPCQCSGYQDLSLGPHHCIANTLPTKLSLLPTDLNCLSENFLPCTTPD